MPRVPLAIVAALVLLAGCSEEDRRAWVSILPGGGGEEEAAPADGEAPAGFALGADSTVAWLDGDTLVTIDRLPDRGPGGVDLSGARFETVSLSPDSGHVAFALRGGEGVVGVWTRARQSARLVSIPRGAEVGAFRWAANGEHLAWEVTLPGGVGTVGAYDLRAGRGLYHPVLSWLARNERSVRIQDWVDTERLRLLVAPGTEPEGGLAWLWELRGGSLFVESHLEPLASNAPRGARLVPGGVFSADLVGDGAPETVAFYVTSEPAPGALVLRDRPEGFAASTTEPLIDPAALSLASWEGIRRGGELADIVDVAGARVLLLSIPVPDDPIATLGFFTLGADGRLTPVQAAGEGGPGPALFPDGRTADRIFDLGLADLDGDGAPEVVAAVGRQDPSTFEARLQWGAQVWRWADGPRLEAAPGLEDTAIERLDRMVAGE